MTFTVPVGVLEQHVAVLGKTGSGKSYAVRGMVERLLDESARVCIIDPTGAWHGLRSSASGKSAGYPVVIFGGSHGDLTLAGQYGEAIAETIGTSTTPAIIDTSLMRVGERATLTACIQFPDGLRREKLTVLTQYKRSSRDTYIQRLREKGLVETAGDAVKATDAGFAALRDAEPLPTGADLQQHWLAKLPEGERKILQILIKEYPNPVDRDTLTAQTGYARSSRDTYLQRMRAKQLWTEPARGQVRASGDLF